MSLPLSPWGQAVLVLQLLKIDPNGLGGIWLRSRHSAVRDRYLSIIKDTAQNTVKIPATASTEDLTGGMDLSATLDAGKLVTSKGLLNEAGWKLATMAERAPASLSIQLGQHLDTSDTDPIIAIDEGIDDETISDALSDRLAFQIGLDTISLSDTNITALGSHTTRGINVDGNILTAITTCAMSFGVTGIRALLFAVAAAKAHAALHQKKSVDLEDAEVAAALVFAHRATQAPAAPEDQAHDAPPETSQDHDGDQQASSSDIEIPQDILLDAVKAALPADLLARLSAQKAASNSNSGGGTGDTQRGNRRGRPLPPMAGRYDRRARLDLVATLRAAAPWQKIRAAERPTASRIHIRSSDLRLKRFEDKSDRLLIFAVDASGSAALARLAEAKGAVELLLAEAYARRDHVSLVAFRGTSADLLLPPTRSLVQTKRRLAALSGGGGTPLAAGIQMGMNVANLAKGKGLTPTLALLTDGRANIALDGTANRAKAAEDAQTVARRAHASGMQCLVIDVSKRPERSLRTLADCLAAPYIPLPRADAKRLSQAVSASLEAV